MMKNKTIVIWIAGITGCRQKKYLTKLLWSCRRKGKKVKLFRTGDMMIEQGKIIRRPLFRKNILDADPWILDERKAAVFEIIQRHVSSGDYDAIIISDHLCFFWKDDFIEAHASFSYFPIFRPQKLFCFVDGPQSIVSKLSDDESWGPQKLDLQKVILWQSTEMILAKSLALPQRIPWFVIPSAESPEVLCELIFNPEAELFFAMVPITHLMGEAGEEDRAKVANFIESFRKIHPAIINPYTIQVGKIEINGNVSDERLAVHRHVLALNDRFIDQADSGVVFMPRVVTSDGIGYEQPTIFRRGKEVFVVHPEKDAGPHKVKFASKVFGDSGSLFRFMQERKNNKK
ncbi:hypothetical protein KKB69_00295 [Patescibacteria group bacterium]|nr:hypothetical protein [Patescibacteria group bacterium]